MASFDPINYDPLEPPRPAHPPVRRGFIVTLAILCLATCLVYGVPFILERAGYAWEAGRSRAASEMLAKLEKKGIVNDASALFRMATVKVAPAVVNIHTMNAVKNPGGQGLSSGIGSGVVIDKNRGYIVTNHHVIRDADSIEVRLGHGRPMTAKLVGGDPQTDLAVIQVSGGLPVSAEWGDSDKASVGDWVLAIGSPFTLDQTVTAGIVSATGRNNLHINGGASYEDFIQTDAAINPGNSGGPLVDLNGRVIGINTAIFTPPIAQDPNHPNRMIRPETGFNTGIGFAISSNMAKRVVEQLIKTGRVARGYLGVKIDELSPAGADALKVKEGQGAVIVDVEPDSPAALAGLRSGDVVVALDDKTIDGVAALRNQTFSLPAGTRATVKYYRDGKTATAQVTIAEMPALVLMGIRLRDVPRELARKLPGAPDSAVIIEQIGPGSAGASANLFPGLRLLEVASKPISTKLEAERAVASLATEKGISIRVQYPDGREENVLVGAPGAHSRGRR